jgi:hypothetical protein
MKHTKELSKEQQASLIKVLKERFETHTKRHEKLSWAFVEEKLRDHKDQLWSIHEMERTGGEPDVIEFNTKENTLTFCDCSSESPTGRRNVCYDRKALDERKKNKPETSAMEMADDMGILLLNEEQYRVLQQLGEFDLKTSSWIKTPENIRQLGGALFCDRRYNTVFVYHNGADSYYGARGFRGMITF